MNAQIPAEVLEAFTSGGSGLPHPDAGELKADPVGGGLINRSYRVRMPAGSDLFLQCINKNVFPNPRFLQDNYIEIWQYAEFEFTGLRLPVPRYYGKGESLFVDQNEEYWRAFEFIGEGKTIPLVKKPSQARAVARAFGRFTSVFADLNLRLLKEVIPGFHDLGLRYSQFTESLDTELYERMGKTGPIIEGMKQRERYKHFYDIITESDEFPRRVMHHDAKIANVLFHHKTGRVICPVDFDTVMPGYFFSDLGDMIRSMACNKDEGHRPAEELELCPTVYEAIVDGYLREIGDQLTGAEKKYIHSSGLIMIYMQTLRFLADYLNGDIYYRITYPEQNFDRAMNQWTLLQKLERFLQKKYSFSV